MWTKFLVFLVSHTLTKADLTLEDRNKLSLLVLDSLGALPLRGIIGENDDGEILINDSVVEIGALRELRESARAALNNKSLNLIRDQVRFEAISVGIHKGENPTQLLWMRAALWFGQEEENKLRILAQERALTLE